MSEIISLPRLNDSIPKIHNLTQAFSRANSFDGPLPSQTNILCRLMSKAGLELVHTNYKQLGSQ